MDRSKTDNVVLVACFSNSPVAWFRVLAMVASVAMVRVLAMHRLHGFVFCMVSCLSNSKQQHNKGSRVPVSQQS